MKKLFLLGALALLIPAMAEAMTVADVIKLSRSGVGDEVVLSQIEASHEVFTLTVDDILELKNAKVSDRVITYMINTGKGEDGEVRDNDNGDNSNRASDVEVVDRYHSDIDRYYRGYNDASANLFLSWGWGGYYSPSWYAYWPGYHYYHYPTYWCGNAYYSYPHYSHYTNHNDHHGYKDGRYIGGRGGHSPGYRGGQGSSVQTGSKTGREYKGSAPVYGGRGRTAKQPANSGTVQGGSQGGRESKSPQYGGRGAPSGRQAPAPSLGTPRTNAGTAPPPPPARAAEPAPSNGSGRTMKGS